MEVRQNALILLEQIVHQESRTRCMDSSLEVGFGKGRRRVSEEFQTVVDYGPNSPVALRQDLSDQVPVVKRHSPLRPNLVVRPDQLGLGWGSV